MNTKNICFKGNSDTYDEYMDFINYVFGFNGNTKDFKKLLPKLYNREYNPVENNYVIYENKKIVATIGAYDNEIEVCKNKLTCRGIGNVAVHPYHRSQGYMRECMNTAINDMIKDGIHFSALGGRRQRYNYFGFEKTGISYNFSINADNIRHNLKNCGTGFQINEIGRTDTDAINSVHRLIQSGPYVTLRPYNMLFDIMFSWQARIFAAYDKDRFIGYCILDGNNISEINTYNKNDCLGIVVSLYNALSLSSLTVSIPEFEQNYIKQLYRFCEWSDISSPCMFNIFRYREVISAFMKLKASYCNLAKGEIKLLIHGIAKDECIKISCENNDFSVENTDGEYQFELSHIEAMNFLFAPICPLRVNRILSNINWFPLPLWLYHADAV